MELPTGTIVDSAYRISTPVRLAKDGDIYLGEPIAPGPPVMIHILRTALMEHDPGLEIFERAGLELCRFSHDAFPEVVDFGRFMVRPYLVMEKVEGKPLSDLIGSDEMGLDRALKIINATRDALQAAHKAGMAHGALTTRSIILTESGEVKILDLFSRWLTQQINSKGKEIDTAADLTALVEISQLLMKGAKRPAAPAASLTKDLEVPETKWTVDTQTFQKMMREAKKTLDTKLEPPPPPMPKLWEEFTPEPEIEMGTPATMVMKVPEEIVAPAPAVRTQRPATRPHSAMQVRLPPPPAQTFGRAVLPTPPPPVRAPVKSAAPAAAKVRLPEPMHARVTPPAPVRPLKPRIASFVPGVGAIDLSDDPIFSPQLQPGYIEFFKNLLPRSGFLREGGSTEENGASRSFNLLITCAVALLMLAAVLNF
jgi:hypothetical protein